jgi:uncharacterized SAM-binding protein YcdF (DUF218 family)
MFFPVAKIFWLLASPSHVLAWLILAAALFALVGWARLARNFAVAAALVLLAVGILPLGTVMARALEDRYPRPAWPERVDGILILSPGFDSIALRQRGIPANNAGEARVVEGFAAARHYPQARVVFTGGSGVLGGAAYSEADTARYIFAQLGLDPARLLLEKRSRNTYENILYSKALVKPKHGEVWLLTTSAIHMPRAIGIARKLDWPMLPWPTDYLTKPQGAEASFYIAENLRTTDYAAYEWVGSLIYRLSGKSSGP